MPIKGYACPSVYTFMQSIRKPIHYFSALIQLVNNINPLSRWNFTLFSLEKKTHTFKNIFQILIRALSLSPTPSRLRTARGATAAATAAAAAASTTAAATAASAKLPPPPPRTVLAHQQLFLPSSSSSNSSSSNTTMR